MQSRINGDLASHVSSGVFPAWLTMASGLLILFVILIFNKRSRRGVVILVKAYRNKSLRTFTFLGGLFGGFFLVIQASAVPIVGVAVFSVGAVAGQSMGSLAVDRLGLAASGRIPITRVRLTAALLAVLAIVVGFSGATLSLDGALLFGFFAFLAGSLIAPQQAGNSRLAVASGNPLSAAMVNFFGGTVVLTLTLGAVMVVDSGPVIPTGIGSWWIWTGGALGVIIITGSAWSVPTLGVLLFSLFSVFGQLSMALFLDIATRSEVVTDGWHLFGAVLLTFIAVLLTARSRFQQSRSPLTPGQPAENALVEPTD